MIRRLVVVGAGSAGTRHLSLAREFFPDADIRVLRHRQGQPVPDTASSVLSTMDEVRAFAPDVGIIASSSTNHAESYAALAEAGAHVLVEKPLAAGVADARALCSAAAASAGVTLVGYNLRFTEGLARIHDLLSEGAIGRLLSLSAEAGQWLPDWRPGSDYRQTVTAQRALGGGALRELSHELDYVAWLGGQVRWVEANVRRDGDLEIDVDDTVEATLGLDSEGVASVRLDLLRRDRRRHVMLDGEHGRLQWDAIAGTVALNASGSKEHVLLRAPDDVASSYRREWEHFLACIRREVAPLISVDDALSTVIVIEACEQSSVENRRIDIPRAPGQEAR